MANSETESSRGSESNRSLRTLLATALANVSVMNALVWLSVPHFQNMYYWIMPSLGLEDYPESFRIAKGICGTVYPAVILAFLLVGLPFWRLRTSSLTSTTRWVCVCIACHSIVFVSLTYAMLSPIFVILRELGQNLPA